MSSVDQWPSREPGTSGVGYGLFSNLGVAALSFVIGAGWFGYRDFGDYHPVALLLPALAMAAVSAVVGLVLVSRRPSRRFGAGVLGGVLFALFVEFGLLGLYIIQVVSPE